MESKDTTFIEIKDLSIAAYLFATDKVHLIGNRKISTGEVLFQFSPKNQTEELVKSYWNMQAPYVQPKKLFNALRDLKDIIFGS